MKKGFIKYSILWLFALGIFNVLSFLLPNDLGSISFWVGYGAVSVAFVLQLISTALFFKQDLLQKRLGKIPVPVFCVMVLIMLLIVSIVYALKPLTVIFIAGYVVVAVQYVGGIIVSAGSDKKGAATGFIADLTKNTAALAQKIENAEIKALAEEIAETAASADSFSDVALAGVENKILAKFEEFAASAESSDVENAKIHAKQLLSFIKERNAKCRILK